MKKELFIVLLLSLCNSIFSQNQIPKKVIEKVIIFNVPLPKMDSMGWFFGNAPVAVNVERIKDKHQFIHFPRGGTVTDVNITFEADHVL